LPEKNGITQLRRMGGGGVSLPQRPSHAWSSQIEKTQVDGKRREKTTPSPTPKKEKRKKVSKYFCEKAVEGTEHV